MSLTYAVVTIHHVCLPLKLDDLLICQLHLDLLLKIGFDWQKLFWKKLKIRIFMNSWKQCREKESTWKWNSPSLANLSTSSRSSVEDWIWLTKAVMKTKSYNFYQFLKPMSWKSHKTRLEHEKALRTGWLANV